MYHLAVAAGSSATFKVGTEYEQLIGKLLDAEGGPGEKPSFCSPEPLSPLLPNLEIHLYRCELEADS